MQSTRDNNQLADSSVSHLAARQEPGQRILSHRAERHVKRGLFYVGVVLLCMVPLFVFFWMISSGLKTQADNIAIPPKIFFEPTFANFAEVIAGRNFFAYGVNSFIVAFGAVAISLFLGLPAAYSIAKYRLRKIGLTLLISRMVPFVSYLIPWFIAFRTLQLIDTYIALITTHLIITLPYVIWVMINFFENVPVSLEESARIDGANFTQSFIYVILPVVRNGVFTASVLAFIFSWNQFLFSLILSGRDTMTVPVAVFQFITYDQINWGGLGAAATLITLPPLVLTLFIQKYIIRGLTTGAVKE